MRIAGRWLAESVPLTLVCSEETDVDYISKDGDNFSRMFRNLLSLHVDNSAAEWG